MPGFILHFIAGNALFLIGSYGIQNYTQLELTWKKQILLYGVCIGSSIIPDFPLALYFAFHLGSYDLLLQPHAQLHYIISPLAVILFIILSFIFPVKNKPIWIMGIFCILIHIIMDSLIQETGIWI